MKTAIITGVTGQDGSYLSDFLIGKGYKVVGTCRRTVTDFSSKTQNISHLSISQMSTTTWQPNLMWVHPSRHLFLQRRLT